MGTIITSAPFKNPQHIICKNLGESAEFDAASLGKVIIGISVRTAGKIAGLAYEGDDFIDSGAYTGAVATVGKSVTVIDSFIPGNYQKVKTDATAVVILYVTNV